MGLGRFGVGGCCLCGPDNPDDPGGGTERAGLCGWCGLYDPNEKVLELPVPPEKLCSSFVFDAFDYSKDYPRVPYWTWQRDLGPPGSTWEQRWLYGDYHHLDSGHFVNSSRGRFAVVDSNHPRHANVKGKLVDTYCKPNQSAGGDSGAYFTPLTNIPPAYGAYGYDYPKRFENGILLNSPTNKTDLIPLRQRLNLGFNTPLNQWPKYLWNYSESYPVACLEPPCTYTQTAAFLHARLVDAFNSDYYCRGDGTGSMAFLWNQPSQESAANYGLWLRDFSVRASMLVPVENLGSGSSLVALDSYLPTSQTVSIWYLIGYGGTEIGNEGTGYATFPMPYKNSFTLSVEIRFDDWPADNRKSILTVDFLIDNSIVYTNQHIIAKPGWRQTGSPTDQQAFIQSFCPGRISAGNEIVGANSWQGSTAPWYREVFTLWDANQTPRESFYIDSWYAEHERL